MDFEVIEKNTLDQLQLANSFASTGNSDTAVAILASTVKGLLRHLQQIPTSLKDNDLSVMEKEYITNCEVVLSPYDGLNNVVGRHQFVEDLKDRLETAIRHPHLYEYGVKPISTFFLFGLPGNGKTYLTKQVAAYATTIAGSRFFATSASQMLTRYQGESEKLFRSLIKRAKEKEHSIVFIDEAEDILGANEEKENDSKTLSRIRHDLQIEIDGVKGDKSNLILIAATNKPWLVQPACLSRFQKQYFVDLPTEEDRAKLFEMEMGTIPRKLKKEDYRKLASMTRTFSARGIRTVTQEAWGFCIHEWDKKGVSPTLTLDHVMRAVQKTMNPILQEELDRMKDYVMERNMK